MLPLIQMAIGITVAIIVVVAVFSITPTIIAAFSCPAINATLDNTAVQGWKTACLSFQTQTTVVPALISLAIVIAAIVMVARMLV